MGFCSDGPYECMYLPNLNFVALPVPGIIAGSQNKSGTPWLCPQFLFPQKNPIGRPNIQIIFYVHSFYGNFRLEFFLSGVANFQSRGRGVGGR